TPHERSKIIMLLSLILLSSLFSSVSGRECDVNDFVYEYTSCGDHGERWRVAVPKAASLDCTGGVPAPQKGLNCTFSCGPGNYLDIATQSCRECSAGSYSLGGGIRFDEFTRLPAGFSVENIDSSQDTILDTASAATPETSINCPAETGWVVRNTELLYIPSPCVSKLSFTANLVRPGYVEYTYRMPTNTRGVSLSAVVKNEQCQSYRDEVRNLLSGFSDKSHKEESSGNGEWQKKRLELRTGPNVISWTITNSRETAGAGAIVMSRIDVVGIAFTRSCTPCPAGTFSERGAAECKPCGAGFFSTKGSNECGICPLSQYSGPKSERCFNRPACKQTDFYPVTEPCVNGKTKRTYKKVLPAVCNEDAPGAAKQPADEPSHPCPACNPGMATSPAGVCEFCPKGEWSDGNGCKNCEANSQPVYGYQFVQWNSLPPHVETRCEFVADDGMAACDIGQSWIPNGDAIVTAPSLQRGIALEMTLGIEQGFHNPLLPTDLVASTQNPIGTITIVFDARCADESCAFYFIEDVSPDSSSSFYRFLGAFNGTQPRRVVSHPITRKGPTRFMFVFVRSGAASLDDSISDQARIFSINVTNVGRDRTGKQGGGAAQCTPCALGAGGCAACDNGHYLDETSRQCTACPPRSYSNISSSRVGVASCVQCGPGLESDGSQCLTNGKISIALPGNGTREYDLSSLVNKTFLLQGVRVFAREGTSYFHHLNISMVGAQKVVCREVYYEKLDRFTQQAETVEGAACRLTAVPIQLANNTQKLAFVAPMLIASQIAAITEAREFDGWQITDSSLGYGAADKDRPLDLHVFFEGPKTPQGHCVNGTALAVTLRCDPNEKKIEMKFPPTCPDGTCDGCLYQAILESSIACPLCGKNDYKIIKGECIDGKQTIHSIPQKHCVVAGEEAKESRVACSVISENLRMLLIMGAIALVTLLIVLCVVFRRNQRLEYKYMKLSEAKGGSYELAAADSCGLDEDEDDDEEFQDRVIFSKGRSGNQPKQKGGFFSRLAQSSVQASAPSTSDRAHFANSIEDDED
ncbi:hypothetical protein PENTCL1PPCAC_19655, partial [Pristionchus entomophagus]